MFFSTRLSAAAVSLLLAVAACGKDDSSASEKTQGGENAFDRAGRKVDRAHQDFKQEVKPAAKWVDEKANEAASEGKKAARKTADAVDDAVSD